jgi:hypothetical protein
LTAALILIVQYLTASGQVVGVNFQYDVEPARCEVLAQAHTRSDPDFRSIARCVEVEPSIEELLAPVSDT